MKRFLYENDRKNSQGIKCDYSSIDHTFEVTVWEGTDKKSETFPAHAEPGFFTLQPADEAKAREVAAKLFCEIERETLT